MHSPNLSVGNHFASKRLVKIFFITLWVLLYQGCAEETSLNTSSKDETQPTNWVELVRGDQWEIEAEITDPYIEWSAGRARCQNLDYGPEYTGVEISTVYCDYLTLGQGLLHEMIAGDYVELTLWHSPLVSDEPSQGLLEVRLEERILFSRELLIPADAHSWTERLRMQQAFLAGARVTLHVHNHGRNTYTLASIRRGR